MGCEQSKERQAPLDFGASGDRSVIFTRDGAANGTAPSASAAVGPQQQGPNQKKPPTRIDKLTTAAKRVGDKDPYAAFITFEVSEGVPRDGMFDLDPPTLPQGSEAGGAGDGGSAGESARLKEMAASSASSPIGAFDSATSAGGAASAGAPFYMAPVLLSNMAFNLCGPSIAAADVSSQFPQPDPSDVIAIPCFDIGVVNGLSTSSVRSNRIATQQAAAADASSPITNTPLRNNNNGGVGPDGLSPGSPPSVFAGFPNSDSPTTMSTNSAQQCKVSEFVAIYNSAIANNMQRPSNGLLYRLVATDGTSRWAFYNDSQCYEFTAVVTFEKSSSAADDQQPPLRTMGTTTRSDNPDGTFTLTTIVFPGETALFFAGAYEGGFQASYSARLVSDAYLQQAAKASDMHADGAMAAVEVAMGAIGIGKYLHYETRKTLPLSAAEDVLQACLNGTEANGHDETPFVDLTFPPNRSSLHKNGGTLLKKTIRQVAWKRPKDIIAALAAGASDPAAADSSSTSTSVASGGTFCKFAGPIDASTIHRGQLRDGWLVSAIAAVAENATRIHDVFRHPISEDSADSEEVLGAYRVNLNVNGWWQNVIVDDFLPTIGNWPCFIHLRRHPQPFVLLDGDSASPKLNSSDGPTVELWASLIEKAFAKSHGSYSALSDAGDALEAIAELTGGPYMRFDNEWKAMREPASLTPGSPLIAQNPPAAATTASPSASPAAAAAMGASQSNSDNAFEIAKAKQRSDAFFERLVGLEAGGFITILNTPGHNPAFFGASFPSVVEKYKKVGLLLGHAYVLMDVREYPEYDLQLCRIRNPFAVAAVANSTFNTVPTATNPHHNTPVGTWNGDWSDSSDLWNVYSAVAEDCYRGNAVVGGASADGSFWMCFADVKKYFVGGGVCFAKTSKLHDYRIKGQFDGLHPTLALEVSVYKPTEFYITLTQQDRRRVRGLTFTMPKVATAAAPLPPAAATAGPKAPPQAAPMARPQPAMQQPLPANTNTNAAAAPASPAVNVTAAPPPKPATVAVAATPAPPQYDYAPVMISVCGAVESGEAGSNGDPVSRNELRYQVISNSNPSVVNPSEAFDFQIARDVSMKVTLAPSNFPYLIVPRLHPADDPAEELMKTTPFVLSVLSSNSAGTSFDANVSSNNDANNNSSTTTTTSPKSQSDAFSIKFRRLDGTSKIFANHHQFGYDDVCTPVTSAEYQYIDPVACATANAFAIIANRSTTIPPPPQQ